MRMREGDKIKSIFTGRLYEVKTLKDWAVVLESVDGSSQIWTEKDNLKLFYEKVENEESPKTFGLSLSPAPKLLRSPSKIGLDFL